MSKADLKSAGLKVTLPRLRVLEVLQDAQGNHLSAEDVYRRLMRADQSVGLATVYRVLTQFHSAGIVERHHFDDNHAHAVFELSDDEHHDHMIDVDTGEITEFVNQQIEDLQEQIATDGGYELVDHELVLYVKKKPAS